MAPWRADRVWPFALLRRGNIGADSLDARKSHGPEEAAWTALRLGWVPCTLAAATTAIGLGSLVVSQLSPIRSFGVYGAIGTMLTLGVVLAFLPCTLAAWKPKAQSAAAQDTSGQRHPAWDW